MNFLKNLIGGQLVKGYSTSGDPVTGLGNHKYWKMYKGKKQSTGTNVSVFVLQKKQLKSVQKQLIIKNVKKQVMNLAKLRHPGILSVVQPLQQDDNNLTFVTQSIEGNITTLMKQKKFVENYLSSQLDLKLHLFPLLQTLQFLHQNVKLCHLGINFNSIYITSQGRWKLGSMNYSQTLTDDGNPLQQINKQNFVQFHDYSYLPPEAVNLNQYNKFSDSYSIGILIVNLFMILKNSYNNLNNNPVTDTQSYKKTLKSYKSFTQFPAIIQSKQPQQIIQLLSSIIIEEPQYRLTINAISNSKWINDPIIITTKCLEKITQYENKQQLQFLKGLAGIIDKFEEKILLNRILIGSGGLINLLKFNHLVASIVFILLDIMKRNLIKIEEFKKYIWPDLKPITQGKQMTAQSLYLIVSHMQIMEKYITPQQFMLCIIPLFLKCFDCNAPKLKVLALKNVQKLSKKYDYQFTKTKIIPKLCNCIKDQKIEIRKDVLKVLHSIVKSLDPQTIVTLILPGLQSCRKAGPIDGLVNALIVQIYKKITMSLSGQVLATKVMPTIMPYLIDPSIQKNEFLLYKSAVFKMIQKIQNQRSKNWNQSNSKSGDKTTFTQNDFIIEKHVMPLPGKSNEEKNKSQKGLYTNENKFDFLNEYKNQKKPQMRIQSQTTHTTAIQNSKKSPKQPINHLANIQSNFTMQYDQKTAKIDTEPKKQSHQTFKSQNSHVATQIQISNKNKNDIGLDFDNFNIKPSIQNQNLHSNQNAVKDAFDFASEFDMNPNNQNTQKYQPPTFPNDFDEIQQQIQSKQTVKPKQQPTAKNQKIVHNPTNNDTFTFQVQEKLKSVKKQQPYSPITVAQPSLNKPSQPQSASKKLVGPSSGKGGLKKPPKYNQFNLPSNIDKIDPSLISRKEDVKIISDLKKTEIKSSVENNLPKKQQFENFTIKREPQSDNRAPPFSSKLAFTNSQKNSNDDPFADLDKEYGINKISDDSNVKKQNEGFENDFDLI